VAGVLALVCVGLMSGAGTAGAARLQAKAHETALAKGFRSLDTSSQRVTGTMWSAMTHTAPVDGHIHRIVSNSPKTAGTAIVVPVLRKALPSRSNHASPTGLISSITRGHGNAFSPASRAQHVLATLVRSRVRRMPDIGITHAQIPSVRRVGLRDLTGTITQMSQVALHAGPLGRVRSLQVRHVPSRSGHLSLLSLERVLDRQTFAAITTVSIARSHGEPAEDLALTARRPPVADGLKMVGVHPAATQYLHATTNTHSSSTASEPGYSKASLTQPAKPNKGTGSPATWTAATMPGGNAHLCWITGYTWTGGRTATGTYPHWGTVAVDPSIIPLGSTVYIQGLGVFHAEDTGGAVVGQHVDVYVDSAAEAYQLTGYRLVSFVPPSS
jgi:3D (Asp-Asp-Asp) domain-containing protein